MRRLRLPLALFALACAELPQQPPAGTPFGSVHVMVITDGLNFDPNGYWLVLDSAYQGYGIRFARATADTNWGRLDDVIFVPLLVGTHLLSLTDVSSNCAVVDGPDRSIGMDPPREAFLRYDVICQ